LLAVQALSAAEQQVTPVPLLLTLLMVTMRPGLQPGETRFKGSIEGSAAPEQSRKNLSLTTKTLPAVAE
ncbi:MAG TPA: hypothetical protein VK927_02245, partial [Adhaeribacter sp.]|nr:hypothetical protein [Adhaeribacter sp.]